MGGEGRPSAEGRRGARRLFGFEVSPQTQEQLLAELLEKQVPGTGPQLVVTANLDHVVKLRRNALFREAYAWAWRVTVDGAPVQAYARLKGVAPPARIPGADLFAKLAQRWSPTSHRLFFCVCSAEAAERMRDQLAMRGFGENDVSFAVPPFGFDADEQVSASLAANIRAFAPTHLIMAVGSPKSEIWIYRHRDQLGDMRVFCVGAAVEFLVGLKRRAPAWMRSAGLEWSWRLASEPRRLFKRYCIESFGFLAAIAEDLGWRRVRPG
jgi:N-acetylglucosaminyldiphosphoundecaprenol N-acetyl-beta-D-mannosaminyltransferase